MKKQKIYLTFAVSKKGKNFIKNILGKNCVYIKHKIDGENYWGICGWGTTKQADKIIKHLKKTEEIQSEIRIG